jgi:hypothetical protein
MEFEEVGPGRKVSVILEIPRDLSVWLVETAHAQGITRDVFVYRILNERKNQARINELRNRTPSM